MADPTRPLPNLVPQPDGSWVGHSTLTPSSFNTRGLFTLPSSKVVPVIVVPGIMGSNLRAATHPSRRANRELNPGEEAWRAPNGPIDGVNAARMWKNRSPATRQLILDGGTLEVDRRGEIDLPSEARDYGTKENEVRERGWGEVHWDSYGKLLYGLYIGLNRTFETDPSNDNARVLRRHWKSVMDCDPARWGVRSIEKLTETELEKHADYYYPVYACGYNWLESCEISAKVLRKRIEDIIAFWKKGQKCEKVILVTHSMGGLVARACAKEIPDLVLGVIHGVMPALGAPVCYRRIACGTEKWSPSNGEIANKKAGYAAEILGEKPAATMAVMATSPGALQLLPNHLYPQPWLHVYMVSKVNNKDTGRDVVHLPLGNPYDMYRDIDSWYRLVDPELADPANKYKGEGAVAEAIRKALNSAERFHRDVLGTYYHPNTYAFYGADPGQLSFGAVRWVARDPGAGAVFTDANLRGAARISYGPSGGRRVRVEKRTDLHFVPARQDVPGDGTVPYQSGAGPGGKVRQVFEIRGFDHQEAFNDDAVLLLTHHLIAKLVQAMP